METKTTYTDGGMLILKLVWAFFHCSEARNDGQWLCMDCNNYFWHDVQEDNKNILWHDIQEC